jgi:hypothetical protein
LVGIPVAWIVWQQREVTSPPPTQHEAPPVTSAAISHSVLHWKRQGTFPISGFQFDPVESKGHLYVVGGWNGKALSETRVAPVNEDGSLGPWRATSRLPEADQGPGVVVCGNSIVVSLENGNLDRAEIKEAGELGAWARQPAAVPWHGGRLSLRYYQAHLYLFGGFHYRLFENVLFAPIQADGAIGTWRQTSSMPNPQQHHVVHFYADRVYLIGGITSRDEILKSAYSAPVMSDGTIGSWRRECDLPKPLWCHNSVQLGDHIIVFGGSTGYKAGTSDEILCGLIRSEDGAISRWVRIGRTPGDFVSGMGVVHSSKSGLVYLIGGTRGYRADITDEIWSISASELMDAYLAAR